MFHLQVILVKSKAENKANVTEQSVTKLSSWRFHFNIPARFCLSKSRHKKSRQQHEELNADKHYIATTDRKIRLRPVKDETII